MARSARLKADDADAWYHVCARVSGSRSWYPLAGTEEARKLLGLLEFYTRAYFCGCACVVTMGTHWHGVLFFEAPRAVAREELEERARLLYPGKAGQERLALWNEERWERLRERLFDISELMRNVQGSYARWFNRKHDRRGGFWADRFSSNLIGGKEALVETMLYNELNPVRAGMVERPEDHAMASLSLREIGQGDWLMPLRDLLDTDTEDEAIVRYRELIYLRGAVCTKEGQAPISEEVLEAEIARGFASTGIYRRRLSWFVSGVAIGSEAFVREQIARLRQSGLYLRRRHPIVQSGGLAFTVREQRGRARAV